MVWKTVDMFTGEEKNAPSETPGITRAWLDGWNWAMFEDDHQNPYDFGTPEWEQWEAGWEAAQED